MHIKLLGGLFGKSDCGADPESLSLTGDKLA